MAVIALERDGYTFYVTDKVIKTLSEQEIEKHFKEMVAAYEAMTRRKED